MNLKELQMIIQTEEFRRLKKAHARSILTLLLIAKEEFNILCHLEGIEFKPALPEEIMKNFQEVILFAIANYTLDSARIDEEYLAFEAGFGEENIGSMVIVPIENIIQINQEDVPIPLFINPAATLPKPKPKPKNPFALNPRNKRFMSE